MLSELFSVWDAAANRYMDIFCAPTLEFAIRGFSEACQQTDHQFWKYPEDYALYHVGTFKPDTGEIDVFPARKIAMANAYAGGFGNQLKLDVEKEAQA